MSNTKHTPGPWELQKKEVNYRNHYYVLWANGIPHHASGDQHPIGSIDLNDHYSHNWQFPTDESGEIKREDSFNVSEIDAEANAKLIAAAPELFKALNSLVLSVMAHPDYTGEENEEWTDLIETAEEAIKKATE